MVRDLLELGVNMVRQEHAANVRQQAEEAVETRLAHLLLGETGQPPATGWVKSGEAGRHGAEPDDTSGSVEGRARA